MGSCGSSSRVEKPLQISNPVSTPKQEDETEEIKTPDKYCKPSVEFYEEFANRQNDTDFIKTKDMSQRPSRSQSAFNLQRDLIESLKNEERIRRLENPSSEWREKNDATSYKITEEQHTAIYIFVEEKNRIIYEEIFKLYTHLIRNIQEHEDLSLFIEYLRGHNKDVENCIEDLQAHPIDNEKYFYRTVEKNRKLIKLLVSEYNTYRKNIKNYRGFREVILSCIKQYNLSQQDTGVSDETPELQPFKEKSQIVIIQNDDIGDAFNKFTKYLDQLKEDKIMLIKMWETLKIESVNKTKESDRKISETKIQIFQKVKSIKPKYQELDNQIDIALSNFEGGFEEYFVSSNEDIIKLKQLGREVKDQKEALVNFERILMEEKGYQSISKITVQEKIYETSEKGSATLKKLDNNRMFLDGKPTSSAKIQMRRGDNTDIELEFPNENEESPNLTHKLRSLNSGEAYRVKHKSIVV